jgi:hypothetical protein
MPSPATRSLVPESTPGGILTSTVCLVLTLPDPPQLAQRESIFFPERCNPGTGDTYEGPERCPLLGLHLT